MSGTIDYGTLMHHAMRGLIQSVLRDVARNGLPGDHHFFITFDTGHPDVEIADWLSDRYPGDMTVVMQHWFDDLQVDDEGFAVTLNFGEAPERLYIPFDAVRTFVDPSVEFGLRFDDGSQPDRAQNAPVAAPVSDTEAEPSSEPDPQDDPPKTDAEIVSLDKFRK